MTALIIEPFHIVESTEKTNQEQSVDDNSKDDPNNDQKDLGVKASIELIDLHKTFDCKIDTGASCCSLGVSNIECNDNIVQFELDDKIYKMNCSKQTIQTADGGEEERPVVKFNCKINDEVHEKVQFNLNDRSDLPDQVLIGMNLIEKLKCKIDPN